MKTSKAVGIAALCATIAVTVVLGTPDRNETSRQPDKFMVRKRIYTQTVLDALMNEHYDAIVIAGENMKKMNQDKRWERLITEDYRRLSDDFQMQTQAMVDAARKKNLDGAMDAYLKSLQTCYNCHKYVRGAPRDNHP